MPSAIVIGAGPIGALAARLLAQHGWQVTLVNRPSSRSSSAEYKAGETLPPVANSLLKQLGIYDLIQQGPHVSCPGNQSAFGSDELVDFDFIYSSNGQGWHLDRTYFEQQLLQQSTECGVTIISANVRDARFENAKWTVNLSNLKSAIKYEKESTLTADYLIDASGQSRFLARQQGITINHYDKLAARVAVFKTETAQQDHRTLIEADRNGWWYSTCVPNKIRIVAYFSDLDLEAFQSCNSEDSFLSQLEATNFVQQRLMQECLKISLSEISSSNFLSFFTEAAKSSQMNQVQGEQWIAIGDAAASYDPLSSQGLWSGFQSASFGVQSLLAIVPQESYSKWNRMSFQSYLSNKKHYYGMEKRWRDSEFWVRRTSYKNST